MFMLICLLYGLRVQYEHEHYVHMSCKAYMYNMKMIIFIMLICLLYGLRVQYEDECYVDMSVVWLTCTI